MAHPLDRPIASDLSFQVFQLRARRRELGTQSLDSTNQTLHVIAAPSVFDAFIADRDLATDTSRRQFVEGQ